MFGLIGGVYVVEECSYIFVIVLIGGIYYFVGVVLVILIKVKFILSYYFLFFVISLVGLGENVKLMNDNEV